MERTNDIRIAAEVPLVSPADLSRRIPMTEAANATVVGSRAAIRRILSGGDQRLIAVVGPCSIHDPDAAVEYARRLAGLNDRVADTLVLVMRVYFEKPRTALGWRGLIIDPTLDGSYDIARGLSTARKLLVTINEAGVPAGTEMLDPIVPQYIAELVSWAAIGARTTESQTHREMASGLSMPVGFKNSTDGDIQIAINAMLSARQAHSFLGIDTTGSTCVLRTLGNTDCHLILRGGKKGPNYQAVDVGRAANLLANAGLRPAMIVDCSHGNSNKQPESQAMVLRDLITQRSSGVAGSESIVGFMVESNLEYGSQPIPDDLSTLKRGVSITDSCIGWKETEELLIETAKRWSRRIGCRCRAIEI
ncbi:MAG: 3-deoxy-7-phosphoheptulonate synthase [Chitinispirillaceae bacterium]|nr:3-deoxy-7-phosphoheptulonate synthase [Chitinispirillaceae bacterium]